MGRINKIIEVLSKIVIPVKTGIQRFCNILKRLDSHFRGNDKLFFLKTFARASIVLMFLISGGLAGCYKQIPLEKPMVPVEFKVVPLDEPAPPQGEADIIITTHIKKKSYIFDPRTAETPYVFTLWIDGKELRESVKGVEEIISDMEAERGKGIHYNLKKRLRLKQGSYTIALRSEDRRSVEINIKLEGGKLYTLRFEPFYGLKKYHGPKLFEDGVERYQIYWDEIK